MTGRCQKRIIGGKIKGLDWELSGGNVARFLSLPDLPKNKIAAAPVIASSKSHDVLRVRYCYCKQAAVKAGNLSRWFRVAYAPDLH
jgi:hypothetical protein